ELPGELAPKLALAIACELNGDLDRAVRYYDVVSRADPAQSAAALGLGRCQEQLGDRDRAAEAYRRVPATSRLRAHAQMRLAWALTSTKPGPPGEAELARAAAAIDELAETLDGLELHELSADLLRVAAALVEVGVIPPNGGALLLGVPLLANA